MISRLTATATLVALLGAATLAGAASARNFGFELGTGGRSAAAAARSTEVRIVELPRVVVVGRRLPAGQ